MDTARQLKEIYHFAAMGQEQPLAFLWAFHGWAHRIDDVVDEPFRDRLEAVEIGMTANILFSSPFYVQHAGPLQLVVALVADAYRTSVEAERAGGAAADLADTIRLAGNQMVLAVAFIMGGWDHMRAVSAQLWPLAWASQHPIEVVCLTHQG